MASNSRPVTSSVVRLGRGHKASTSSLPTIPRPASTSSSSLLSRSSGAKTAEGQDSAPSTSRLLHTSSVDRSDAFDGRRSDRVQRTSRNAPINHSPSLFSHPKFASLSTPRSNEKRSSARREEESAFLNAWQSQYGSRSSHADDEAGESHSVRASRYPSSPRSSHEKDRQNVKVYYPPIDTIRSRLRPVLDLNLEGTEVVSGLGSHGGSRWSVDDLGDELLERMVTDKSVAKWKGLRVHAVEKEDGPHGGASRPRRTLREREDVSDLVDNAGEHNEKLVFFGRRAVKFHLTNSLLTHLRPSEYTDVLRGDLVDLLTHRRVFGQFSVQHWSTGHYTRYIRVRQPDGTLGESHTQLGNTVFAAAGAVWWLWGQRASQAFFEKRILPCLSGHLELRQEVPREYKEYALRMWETHWVGEGVLDKVRALEDAAAAEREAQRISSLEEREAEVAVETPPAKPQRQVEHDGPLIGRSAAKRAAGATP